MLELACTPPALSVRRRADRDRGRLIVLTGVDQAHGVTVSLVIAEDAFWQLAAELGGPGGVALAGADELHRLNGGASS